MKDFVAKIEAQIGQEQTIYEDGVSLTAKDRPKFVLTAEMVEAGTIRHKHHPYSHADDSGYHAFVVQRPLTAKELREEQDRAIVRAARQAEQDRQTFEALKAKGYS